jgi:predicted Zn-dependent protease
MRRGWIRAIAAGALALALALVLAAPLRAQTILRDAELERALAELARPVIAASGLSPAAIRIYVIEEPRLNAFVVDGQTIAITSGLLLRMTRPAMLQAVIAHEVAHIANGHLTRRAANARTARTAALFGLALSAALATENPAAAGGLAAGTASSAGRVFLSHTRAEEAAADQAAVRYLARANVDPAGMIEVLDLFRGQEALSGARQDPYARTHPLSRQRLRALRGFVAAYAEGEAPDPQAAYWFARGTAKLSAYLRNPRWTLRRLDPGDQSDAALVARAVAHLKNSDLRRSLAAADALVARRPNDAYARELRGWILFETRNFGHAANAYARAAELAPDEGLLWAGYGRALLALDRPEHTARALTALERARARDPYDPRMLRDLAVAHARQGNIGQASLATAERYAVTGALDDAAIHARRAAGALPRGSPGWRRAEDIRAIAERQDRRTTR